MSETQRDELVQIIDEAAFVDADGLAANSSESLEEIADSILAAGYRRQPEPQWKCKTCGYPDDEAGGKYWRCSICAGEDYEDVTPAPTTKEQPLSEFPFLVHTEGPDDIEPFATWAEACVYAHDINSSIVAYNARSAIPGTIRAWAIPYSLAAHTERWDKIMAVTPSTEVTP